MGLGIAVVMDFRRRYRVLSEKFTSLEAIVYPMLKPEDGCMLVFQIFDMYSVRKAQTEMEQWRIIFSDAEYYVEAVLAPELTENARSDQFKNGLIVRIVEFELYECLHYEFRKRIIKVIQLEVLLKNFRVIGNEPMCLNWEEWREEDWEEDNWIWIDPDEQAYEGEGFWEEPCGFRDLTEAITPHAVRDINTNRNAELHPIIFQITDVRSIGNPQTERFRVVLSDGEHLQQAVLAPHLNEKVNDNAAVRGSIVFLLEYRTAMVQEKRVVIVLDMKVLKRDAEIGGDLWGIFNLLSNCATLPLGPVGAPCHTLWLRIGSAKCCRCSLDFFVWPEFHASLLCELQLYV